ncbi:limonene-1,2-epoxide hydrolase family protein [Nocardia sp. CS682]|uniref:limonene-1,2-epoxide hydrolase family protein n=1 Tax=Nocardia sp. CS682 TaxID=1047172 RepID=UPI0010752D8C|nr:limonene-1,2-epoxide hydrolase family protein [Nocardia sp. CS682]QBS41217.1 epoxide hydrolase [Nocardia sp. CS682]
MTQDLELQQDAITTVREFLSALELGAVDEALELLHPDVVWKNTSLPDVGGGLARKILRNLNRDPFGFEVDVHHIAADGNIVLTDRTDFLQFGPLKIGFWVTGTFELRDGRIILWHDHFSWENLLRGTAVGVWRAVFSRD